MGRPTTETDLLAVVTADYGKLNTPVSELTEKELPISSDFSGDEKKEEVHWKRDKNLRDVFIHLYEWRQPLPNWVYSNQNGGNKPFIPEPYNWKTYRDANMEFWRKHQSTSLGSTRIMFQQSHNEVVKLAETFSDEELFSKGVYRWVGGSTLSSYLVSATTSHYDWAMERLETHRKNHAKMQRGHIIHLVKVKGILSAKNGIDLCWDYSRGYIYCDSRSRYYRVEHASEDIKVKGNVVDSLEYVLIHRREKYAIGIGSMTDPYIPLELEIGNIRKVLNPVYERDFGFYSRFLEEKNDGRQLGIWDWGVR